LPIDLPQLAGAHTGEAISSTVIKTLEVYGVIRDKLVTSYSIMLLITTLRSLRLVAFTTLTPPTDVSVVALIRLILSARLSYLAWTETLTTMLLSS
jgi:hypothetical protein